MLSPEDSAARRERALEEAKGLNAGVEEERSTTRLSSPATQAGSSDVRTGRGRFDHRHSARFSRRLAAGVDRATTRRVGDPLSAYRKPCAADRLRGDVMRSMHHRAPELRELVADRPAGADRPVRSAPVTEADCLHILADSDGSNGCTPRSSSSG